MHDVYPGDTSTTGRLELDTPLAVTHALESDWFRVSMEAWTTYELTVAGTGAEIGLVGFLGASRESTTGLLEGVRRGYPFEPESKAYFTAKQTRDFFVSVINPYVHGSPFDYSAVVSKYEVIGNVFTPIDLAPGSIRRHDIETAFDRDFFGAPMVGGFTYEINLQGVDSRFGSLTDPNLRVYDSEQNLLANNNDGGIGRDSKINFTAPSDGRYFISASGLGDATGFYRISYTLSDYGDDAATGPATKVRLDLQPNQIAAFFGSQEISTDIDWFKVDLVAGRWYQFGFVLNDDVLSSDRQNAVTFLRDPEGNIVAQAYGDSVFSLSKDFYVKATHTGTHHLVFRNRYDSYAGRFGDYRLFGVDNAPPAINSRHESYRLVGGRAVRLTDLFSINDFPAEQVQVYSEAKFFVGTTQYSPFELHSVPVDRIRDVVFSGVLYRGDYDVSIRAVGDGIASGWAQSAIHSEPSSDVYLNIGELWDATNTQRQNGKVITYRFADSVPSYFADGRFTGFEEVNAGVREIFERIFESNSKETYLPFSNFMNLAFEYDDSENADMQIFTADSDDFAVGYRPGKYGFGDIVLNNEFFASKSATPEPGSRNYFELIRAVGTALGLKHFAPQLSRDQSVTGILTVPGLESVYTETLGEWDVKYLASKYGNGRRFLSQEHSLGVESQSFVRTINRTTWSRQFNISAVESTRSAVIDLRIGEKSYLLGDGPSQTYIVGAIDPREFPLEQAYGSQQDDWITGSHSINTLVGNGGNDLMAGLTGNDDLQGGNGSDTYLYETGDGFDVITESGLSRSDGGIDTLRISGKFGMNRIDDDLTFRKNGNDLLIELDMNGQFNRNNETITIKSMNEIGTQVEKLDLRNFSQPLGVFSLVSIWNGATYEKQRFVNTGVSDEFGLIASPIA